MKPLVVLVLEGEYRLTGAVLFCLGQADDIEVHVVQQAAASPYQYSRYVRSHHRYAPELPEAGFVDFVRDVATDVNAAVLLPVDVAGMRWAIRHAAALAPELRCLPLPTAEAYETAADKSRLADFMRTHHIDGPDTLLDITRDYQGDLAALRFPVLLKPVDGAGGQGIARYETPETLRPAVAALPEGARYIIQTYLEGYDIDCNVLCHNGQVLAHSVQRGLVPAASAYAPTQAIEFVNSPAVVLVVRQLMAALRWNGVAHIDLRYDTRSGRMNVIEINPRFWLTVVGSALAAHVNFPALACRAALGRPVPTPLAVPGRYIPFANFLQYKYGRRRGEKIPFALADTSVANFLGDPLPKLFYLLRRRQVHIE